LSNSSPNLHTSCLPSVLTYFNPLIRGDHTDVAQAAVAYVLFLLAIFVYCKFGEELSHQVIIICLLQTDYSDCIP
jgi:hypothetical protein